ncbi:hypothetical protein [Streptomyces sp. NPDC002853]
MRRSGSLNDGLRPAPPAGPLGPDREILWAQNTLTPSLGPILADTDFVLVRGARGEIGILTVRDVVLAYGTQATPFLLIGELDPRLRAVITDCFDLAAVTALCDRDGSRSLISVDQLTFRERWEDLGWPLDRAAFAKRLDEIRKVRNDLMRFNPDPLPRNAEAKVRGVMAVLRQYAGC